MFLKLPSILILLKENVGRPIWIFNLLSSFKFTIESVINLTPFISIGLDLNYKLINFTKNSNLNFLDNIISK
jgi:hypothetical protein